MTIRVIDIETTGIYPTDHVVEIGSVDLLPDGSITKHQEFLVLPPCPIPAEARAIHHISDADVAQAKSWSAVCSTYFDRGNCLDLVAFAAHNSVFDQQWLPPDLLGNFPLVCTYKAAVHIWPRAPRHTNQVLRYWLNLDVDRSIADRAHRAMPDAYVTANLLREILRHASIEELIRWTNEPVLLPKVNFGKHRGQKWSDVPSDYLQWILRQQDMNEDIVHTARHNLAERS